MKEGTVLCWDDQQFWRVTGSDDRSVYIQSMGDSSVTYAVPSAILSAAIRSREVTKHKLVLGE